MPCTLYFLRMYIMQIFSFFEEKFLTNKNKVYIHTVREEIDKKKQSSALT